MKIRLLLTLAVLAIWFTVPTFAQQQSAVDPEIRQQIEALLVKGDEAYNKHDASTLAGGFTEDAVFVGGGGPGPHYGRQAIEQGLHSTWHRVPANCRPIAIWRIATGDARIFAGGILRSLKRQASIRGHRHSEFDHEFSQS